MPQKVELPLETQIFINDVVDFLKSIPPNVLPGYHEGHRKDLLQRASAFVAFDDNPFDDDDASSLDYGSVRKAAQMIGSLFLLDRQLPNVKQRTTAVIYDSKLILYNNGKNPQVPLLMLNLAEATINEGIEKSERFCICLNHTVYEFEALDLDERSEWVYELTKRSKDGCHLFDHDDASDEYDILDDDEDKGYDEDGSSIYEEVGEASRIYDIPKRMEEDNPRSLSPPPPLPLRVLKVETNNEEDFPPPPAFEDSPIPHVVPPPPPMPKPTKMIPPPPPPNSNKIQIFTKSSFKAVSSITNKKQQPPQPPTSRSKKTSASSTTSCSSSGKPSEKFVLRNRKNYSSSSSSSSSEPVIIFEDELKQKLLQNIAKKSFLDIDETTFRNQHRAKKDQPDMEEELKAILDKRRQQLLSTNSLSPSNSNFRKTASFRLPPPDKKFDSLPPKPSTLKKPKLPEKKPLFVRSDSLKIHSWNHRLSTVGSNTSPEPYSILNILNAEEEDQPVEEDHYSYVTSDQLVIL